MRVVFLGTPAFAVPSLIEIAKYHEIVGVVTQPDKIGDHNKIQVCETKQVAQKLGLPVYQFNKIRVDGVETLKNLHPDVMVTAAYGQILSQEILDIAPHGILNVHASLLPKLRGAAPINWALINGDKQSGVTIVKTVYALDAGEILLDGILDLDENETAGELTVRLSKVGAYLIREALDLVQKGEDVYTPQDESLVTVCKKITPQMELLDLNSNAQTLHNLIRGLSPVPACYTFLNGKRLKLLRTEMCGMSINCSSAQVGQVVQIDKKGIYFKVGDVVLLITHLQHEGGKAMTAKDFANGRKIAVGTVLG